MIQAIVTDIEGTTSSLSFVKDTLFPYARKHIRSFVLANRDVPAVAAQLAEVRKIVGKNLDIDGVISQLVQWIDQDQKITPLKALQGMVWEHGYQAGDFTGHMYADAVENLQKWQRQGIYLYVYSSGSVQAQKLLFGYSDFGDLCGLFSGFFDTRIGGKRETESYARIAREIHRDAAAILFLSDIREELDAARAAGMQTRWLVRDGPIDPHAAHTQCDSFNSIRLSE